MTPLPKKKHSKARTAQRKSTKVGIIPTLSICPSCKKLKQPHVACGHCGFYK